MLSRYLSKNKDVKVNVHTFGFGYNLESKMLYDLSVEGSGLYSFIPDSSFVGTVFVNTISYILSSMTVNTQLILSLNSGISKINIQTTNKTTTKSRISKINIGPIQFGQSRTVVFRYETDYEINNVANAKLKFNCNGIEKVSSINIVIPSDTNIFEEDYDAHITKFGPLEMRLWFCKTIISAIMYAERGNLSQSQKNIRDLISTICKNKISGGEDIIKDLEGQVTIAFSRQDYVERWGLHYLRSLVRAHQLQVCNNFKDPGVQNYGGELFTLIQDQVDDVFNTLPPPKPSLSNYRGISGGNAQPVTSMRQYNSASNPCFAGRCLIVMSDGSKKKVEDLVKGDKVGTTHGEATLICVLKTQCQHGKAELVQFDDGLIITPWHPIKMNSESSWAFPIHINASVIMPCPYVYSLILDKGHIVTINNVQCITLGHNYKDDIIRHRYFGSQKIINDLKKMPGWDEGLILLKSGCLRANGGIVNEIVYSF